MRRCGYQLLRTTRENGVKAKRDIWASDTTTTSANVKKYGTGKDVDVICMDNGTWFGHIEFINNRPQNESPQDYVGGNQLPGNGICDVLDVVLDGPYYIDPDWFNAAPGSRLTTRWDGTTVPVESEARSWWSNTNNRSASFASYGTVAVPSNYSRANNNGDYNSTPQSGTHGTQCGSQIYGRTHGWAYNCNKWHIDGYSAYGLGITRLWDVQKIFHQAKPVNPKYGTQNPTISSNSWGFRITPNSTGYTFFRDTHGGTGVNYVSLNSTTTTPTRQRFCRYVGLYGENPAYRMKSELRPQSLVTSAKEMVDAGVITVVAAGNSNQKQVNWDHPDYDNYWHTSSTGHFGDSTYFSQHGYQISPTTNRSGFPQNAGATFTDPQSYTIQVTANGVSAYTMTGTDRLGSVSGDNPTITINRGDTVSFVVNASGHPFYIKTSAGSTGTGDQVQYPTATSNGSQSGIVSWTPNQRTPSSLSGASFKYICQYHSSMSGTITVRTGQVSKPTINIGALDDQYETGTKERKVTYSDMGNAIDCFSPADGSLAAYPPNRNSSYDIPRYDNTYLSKDGNTTWSDGTTGTPTTSRDDRFSGTSAACPVAAGLIATVVEFNRNWTHTDIKTWLATLQLQDTTNDFYDGVEDTGADDTGYSDVEKLQGAPARVIYQGGTYSHTTKETTSKELKMSSSISITGSIGLSRE